MSDKIPILDHCCPKLPVSRFPPVGKGSFLGGVSSPRLGVTELGRKRLGSRDICSAGVREKAVDAFLGLCWARPAIAGVFKCEVGCGFERFI